MLNLHRFPLCYVVQVCETLIAYARSSLKRFDTVEDTTGRVLAGGVANRWNTRLKVCVEQTQLSFAIVSYENDTQRWFSCFFLGLALVQSGLFHSRSHARCTGGSQLLGLSTPAWPDGGSPA